MALNIKKILTLSKASDKGFTLVELLVGMVIALIFLAAVVMTFRTQQESYTHQSKIVFLQQNLRAGMYYMEREIRMAGCDPTGTSSAGIITANASNLHFTLDITGGENDGLDNDNDGSTDEDDEDIFSDGDTNDANENVTYSLSGTDLVRNTGGGPQLVAENISSLSFVYYDADGSATTNTSKIRSIQITLQGMTTGETPAISKQLTTRIDCRNLGL